ncbi:MAG TPA: DnaJ C-terminal domain-containing protein [Kofleriaceae bacterium]|nr:DnaJ C-terminal domain-containing protein [Kofleriaceae bacterium]
MTHSPDGEDVFAVLGLPRDAEPETVRRVYADLAFRCLPGVNPPDEAASEKLKQATRAFQIWARTNPERVAAVIDRETRAIFDLMGNFFGAPSMRRGGDRYTRVTIAFVEARDGCVRTIDVLRKLPCTRCAGTGAQYGDLYPCASCRQTGHRARHGTIGPCRDCDGRGWYADLPCDSCEGGLLEAVDPVAVPIPAGVTTGHVMRIPGRGDHAFRAPPGDLYLTVEVDAIGHLVRRDDDVVFETIVTRRHRLFGGSLEVLTLDGPTTIQVPRGVRDGDTLVLAGKGHARSSQPTGDPYRGGPARGDQIIVFRRR